MNKKSSQKQCVKTLMVHLTGHKVNSELLEWIRANPYKEVGRLKAEEAARRRATRWRLRDRLTEVDVLRLVMAFQTGMATKDIAERYGINVKSVRKVLRGYELSQRH